MQKTLFQEIANVYASKKDTQSLKASLNQTITNNQEVRNLIPKEILTSALVAQKYADLIGKENPTSTKHYLKAIEDAKELGKPNVIAWTTLQYARYLYTYRHLKNAFEQYMIGIKILENLPENKIIDSGQSYMRIGYFLASIGELEKSTQFLQKAKSSYPNNSSEYAAIVDNIAVNLIKLNQLQKAKENLEVAKSVALKINDKSRYAKILGNMGNINLLEGNYQEAEKLLLEDISISKKEKMEMNEMFATVLLAKNYLKQNKISNAEKTLKDAEKIASSSTYYKSDLYEIIELQKNLAQQKGDSKTELELRRKMDILREELKTMDGIETTNEVYWEAQKQSYEYQIEAEQAKASKEKLQKIAAIAFIVLLSIIFFVIRRSLRNKQKNEKAQYEKKVLRLMVDKISSENKLHASQQTIKSYTDYLSEKNKQIEILETEIENLKDVSPDFETKKSELENLLQSHLMTQENWEKCKLAYQSEYSQDYLKIIDLFPDLTDSNLRIVILSQLGFKNNEMTRILGVTVEGIKKAKQRLRKKYGEAMEPYLSSVN